VTVALRGPFRFDATTHTYTVGEMAVPGIHAVLRAGGLDQGWLPEGDYLERGRMVHLVSLMYDLGADSVVLPEQWQGYLQAYLRFRNEVSCRWTKMEHPKVHRSLRFATIIDRVGTVSGHPAVVEIKTGYPALFHGPQLAGADILLSGRVRIGLRRRLAVYLLADGTYHLREYSESIDYQRFMDALGAYWGETCSS
jgi:hypothetical protein